MGGGYIGGMVTAFAVFLFVVWLLVTFWVFFLTVGAVALVLWLGWKAWPRAIWWLTVGRVKRQTTWAIEQDKKAYEQARMRMEHLARMYRDDDAASTYQVRRHHR